MRHFYFSAVTAAVFAIPGHLSAQAADTAQTTASAQTVTCKDGTSVQKGRGACSHHGGVVRMVSCKDGSTAKKGRGACSHHGGVAARARASASAGANSNQTKSGVTDTKTGKSTLGKGVTKTSPDQGQPVTAKGDTLSRGDSAASSPR
jgi:hypothetical protein